MSWTDVVDILFFVGGIISASLFVYGAWLCITAPELDSHSTPAVGRPKSATPAAKRLPPRRYDTVQRYSAARRRASAASRRTAI